MKIGINCVSSYVAVACCFVNERLFHTDWNVIYNSIVNFFISSHPHWYLPIPLTTSLFYIYSSYTVNENQSYRPVASYSGILLTTVLAGDHGSPGRTTFGKTGSLRCTSLVYESVQCIMCIANTGNRWNFVENSMRGPICLPCPPSSRDATDVNCIPDRLVLFCPT